jgi:23S rRNA pseudouridine1911/1915/1917 synthase
VHRLDKDTTGVMVVAKNQRSMDMLAGQFKAGEVRKEYSALVHGVPRVRSGVIETEIGRSRSDRKKMSARVTRGKKATTRYAVEEDFGNASLLNVAIETGRTHQIRVHMAHMGHPVVGDPQYGSRRLDRGFNARRQMLHARLLGVLHPRTGERMTWSAPLPEDFAELVSSLRKARGEPGVR